MNVSALGLFRKRRSVLSGFGLTLGYTLLYLGLIVLIPLSALFIKTASAPWDPIWQAVRRWANTDRRSSLPETCR